MEKTSKYHFQGDPDKNHIVIFILSENDNLYTGESTDLMIDKIFSTYRINKNRPITIIGHNKNPETFIKKVQTYEPEQTIINIVFEDENGTKFKCTKGKTMIEATLDVIERYHKKYPDFSTFEIMNIKE